jgi:hypothetical protein
MRSDHAATSRITGVAIVTDSTSYLPAALVRQRSHPSSGARRRLHWELMWERYPKRDHRVHHGGPGEQKADSAKTKTC